MELFDNELYVLICESPEARAENDPFGPFVLEIKAKWLIREN